MKPATILLTKKNMLNVFCGIYKKYCTEKIFCLALTTLLKKSQNFKKLGGSFNKKERVKTEFLDLKKSFLVICSTCESKH